MRCCTRGVVGTFNVRAKLPEGQWDSRCFPQAVDAAHSCSTNVAVCAVFICAVTHPSAARDGRRLHRPNGGRPAASAMAWVRAFQEDLVNVRCGSERMSMGSADIQLCILMPAAHEDSQQHGYTTTGRCADSKHEAASSRTVPNPSKAEPRPDRLAAGIPVGDGKPVNGIGLRARRCGVDLNLKDRSNAYFLDIVRV